MKINLLHIRTFPAKVVATIFLIFLFLSTGFAQESGIEDIIVEQIDASSVMENAITYRVFVDLEEGYEIQAVKGDDDNPLSISTTTTWYNDALGASIGQGIVSALLETPGFESLAFDSYITMGAASNSEFGIPYDLDTEDGAVDGRIVLTDVSLTTAQTLGAIDVESPFGTAPSSSNLLVDDEDGGQYFTLVTGNNDVTPGNVHMIGQFTTDGVFSFCLNLQTRLAQTSQYTETYCSEDAMLTYSSDEVIGIDELQSLQTNLSVFPNPVNDLLQLNLSNGQGLDECQIRIIDAQGRIVKSENWNIRQAGELISLNSTDLIAGVYFVQITSDNVMVAGKRFIKQ